MHPQKRLFPIVGLFAGLLLMGVGCSSTETSDTSSTTSTITETETSEVVVTRESLWTDGADSSGITDDWISGTINGEAVDIAYIAVDDWGDEYRLTFTTAAPSDLCGFYTDDDAVSFRSFDLVDGGTLYKSMDQDYDFDDYHAYYYYEDEDGWPYSVNVDWAATIVVDEVLEDVYENEWGDSIGVVSGWADIEFDDGLTSLSGWFSADLCSYDW